MDLPRQAARWIGFGLALWVAACAPRYRVDRSAPPVLSRARGESDQHAWIGWEQMKGPVEPEAAAEPPPKDQSALSIDLDQVERAIDRFQAQRRGSGPAVDSAWPPFLETLDLYLDQAPERLSLSPLIRARIAAEFELDRERRRAVGMPREFERILIRLLVRIDRKVRAVRTLAATAGHRPPAKHQDGLRWPLTRGVITSGFGTRRDPLRPTRIRFHNGIDLSAPLHEPVYAARDGRVVLASWAGSAGRAVRIRHDDHTETIYGHLAMIMVRVDQRVQAGDVIGLLGQSGRATGPHLHFAVTIDGKAVDPLEHLREVPMAFSDDLPGIVFGYGE